MEEKQVKCSVLPKRKIVSIKKLKVDEVPEIEDPRALTPAEKGFQLEDLVYKESLNLPGLTHSFRENDIKKYFNDSSLNGIDHWIQVGRTHIFIQDKWKQSLNQREVSHFQTGKVYVLVKSLAGYSGDGGPSINAQLGNARGIDVDSSNNLYISDSNGGIRKIDTSGIITTYTDGSNYGIVWHLVVRTPSEIYATNGNNQVEVTTPASIYV